MQVSNISGCSHFSEYTRPQRSVPTGTTGQQQLSTKLVETEIKDNLVVQLKRQKRQRYADILESCVLLERLEQYLACRFENGMTCAFIYVKLSERTKVGQTGEELSVEDFHLGHAPLSQAHGQIFKNLIFSQCLA